ncbi:EAL domain-containing protein [Pollutimonas subterranea]|nr:EAL domain-containing protein [Pollutimonas subterranea]
MIPDILRPDRSLFGRRPVPGISIGQKIGGIFVCVLILAGTNVVMVRELLRDFNGVAATVNVAGKLRMLSQRIAFATLDSETKKRSSLGDIERSLAEFDVALLALGEGGTAFGHDIVRLGMVHAAPLGAVQDQWEAYRANIGAFLALTASSEGRPARTGLESLALRQRVSDGAARLLGNTEALIGSILIENEQAQSQALLNMYGLLLLDGLMLLAAFGAARRQMIKPLRELSRHCHELSMGNYATRVAYRSSDEIGRLALAFNDSAWRIAQLVDHIERDRHSLSQAEAMFRGVAENTMVGVYIVQNDRFRYINSTMAQMFCYDREEMLVRLGAYDIFVEEDRQKVKESTSTHLEKHVDRVFVEPRGRRKDGTIINLEIFGSRMELDGEQVTMGIALDVTARKEIEASARVAAVVYQNSSEAMVVTDPEGVISNVNPAFSAITGYSAEEVIGSKLSLLSSGRHDKTFYEAMWNSLQTTGKWQGDIWNRRKNGEEYAERLTVNTSYNDDGSIRCRVGLFSDITQRKQSDAFIWRQANYDHLTGLPNRQLFQNRLERAITRSKRSGQSMALVFLDLDFFKDVNDTLGHSMGDELLKQVAKRMSACVRSTDTVARLGGDEFTMIIGGITDTDVVNHVCEQVLHELAQPYELGEEAASISTSMGVTLYPQDGSDAEVLLQNADLAMYAAKGNGRNQYCYFTPIMQQDAHGRRQILRDLIVARDQQQFVLHYQPVVELATGRVHKAEALIRWTHPTMGMISPAAFIPVAEDSGIIVGMGDWVFRQATRQSALWRTAHHHDFQISVNVSPVQFMAEGLDHDEWLTHLQQLNLPGHSVVVEITERLLMDANVDVRNKLLAFRDAGIQVALDDFGTGYSSLSYLKKFDIDYIKIDQSFVSNLGPDTDDMALCEAIIVMAHRLGLKVIAEGVETEAQRDLLLRAGCDYGQGYLFSPPLAAEEFTAFLASSE